MSHPNLSQPVPTGRLANTGEGVNKSTVFGSNYLTLLKLCTVYEMKKLQAFFKQCSPQLAILYILYIFFMYVCIEIYIYIYLNTYIENAAIVLVISVNGNHLASFLYPLISAVLNIQLPLFFLPDVCFHLASKSEFISLFSLHFSLGA